ncbi:hypothetical protein PQE74_gp027 [Bacillus phage vB_BanS_Chewbecca]|uniref:Uncharacterized protein n=1 Tax=Bacillus phage vB_BanS_Chewbecca TaxID=2894786 RepID=A0AAE9CAK0_9CAUD|nr:hypothetical protein PQE74_gp027 [Bacillus phage vB_BanS_Chewbecca]UGO46110.1 hypothetical protein CHEWBECCA_27 [Bacillus phage vB_BanS_Chewbecca]
MTKMTVSQIWNKVNELQTGMETMAKALALGMSGERSPQHVIDSLLHDYERLSTEYYAFMEQEIEIIDKDREYVIQFTFDGSFYRDYRISAREETMGEVIIQMTNSMKWAKKFKNIDDIRDDIAWIKSEGHDYRVLVVTE